MSNTKPGSNFESIADTLMIEMDENGDNADVCNEYETVKPGDKFKDCVIIVLMASVSFLSHPLIVGTVQARGCDLALQVPGGCLGLGCQGG